MFYQKNQLVANISIFVKLLTLNSIRDISKIGEIPFAGRRESGPLRFSKCLIMGCNKSCSKSIHTWLIFVVICALIWAGVIPWSDWSSLSELYSFFDSLTSNIVVMHRLLLQIFHVSDKYVCFFSAANSYFDCFGVC